MPGVRPAGGETLRMSLLLLRLLLRLLEADAARARVVATLRGLLRLLEADAAGARIVGALGELLALRLHDRRVGDGRGAGCMGRQRESDDAGGAEQRAADEGVHGVSPGVGAFPLQRSGNNRQDERASCSSKTTCCARATHHMNFQTEIG